MPEKNSEPSYNSTNFAIEFMLFIPDVVVIRNGTGIRYTPKT